ncbi:phosphotransferase [Pseudomonas sp. CrR25]|nr:phosphotransferase [Pseudomonas sp. CrR25]
MSAINQPDIAEVFTAAAPPISLEAVQALVHEHYGLASRASLLSSERDQNFLLETDTKRYVLKITNPAEDRQVTDFHTQAFERIARIDPELPVPHWLPTTSGAVELLYAGSHGDEVPRVVRLMTFMPGVPLYQAERSAAQRRNLGHTLARLGLALRGYFHPAAGNQLLWDIQHGQLLRPLLAHLETPEQRALVEYFLDSFERHALPQLPKLRAQVIHNDFQPYNVLVEGNAPERISGIIDFGDMVYAPLIDDLAVACAYQLADADNPLTGAAELIDAYHEWVPLELQEVEVLYDLIAMRLVLTVLITNWRAALHPHNREYILRNAPLSWRGLERFAALPRKQAQQYLRHVCGME